MGDIYTRQLFHFENPNSLYLTFDFLDPSVKCFAGNRIMMILHGTAFQTGVLMKKETPLKKVDPVKFHGISGYLVRNKVCNSHLFKYSFNTFLSISL